jgi:hypothetical protein
MHQQNETLKSRGRKISNGKLEQCPIRALNESKGINECKKIFQGEDVTAISESQWFFNEDTLLNLQVNVVIHGYHVQ